MAKKWLMNAFFWSSYDYEQFKVHRPQPPCAEKQIIQILFF